jgi:hypothetical protein
LSTRIGGSSSASSTRCSLLPLGATQTAAPDPALIEFRYAEIRKFGSSVIHIIGEYVPDCRHLAMMLHGANVGLDEVEALLSMLTGCMEAVAERPSRNLERVSVVERDASRAGRIG